MVETMLSEKELVGQLREGDRSAFEQLYHLHKRKLAGILLRLLKEDVLVEEVLLDLFLKIWEQRESIDLEKSFRSYLFQVARIWFTTYSADPKETNVSNLT